jgi:hypothetical protein
MFRFGFVAVGLALGLSACASTSDPTVNQLGQVVGSVLAVAPAAEQTLCNQLSKTPKKCKALAGVATTVAGAAVK